MMMQGGGGQQQQGVGAHVMVPGMVPGMPGPSTQQHGMVPGMMVASAQQQAGVVPGMVGPSAQQPGMVSGMMTGHATAAQGLMMQDTGAVLAPHGNDTAMIGRSSALRQMHMPPAGFAGTPLGDPYGGALVAEPPVAKAKGKAKPGAGPRRAKACTAAVPSTNMQTYGSMAREERMYYLGSFSSSFNPMVTKDLSNEDQATILCYALQEKVYNKTVYADRVRLVSIIVCMQWAHITAGHTGYTTVYYMYTVHYN